MTTEKIKEDNDIVPLEVIHIVPAMTEYEREMTKKKIGNDLYDIFLRIQEHLNSESEL